MTITEVLDRLNEIAATADRERLLVWYPEFREEFPAFAGLIDECLKLSAAEVLPYLARRHTGLRLLMSVMGPEWTKKFEQTAQFVHATLKEKIK